MSNLSYRNRLSNLENELYKQQSLWNPLYFYPISVLILFLILSIGTPSFLYTSSKKKPKKKVRSWGMIFIVWIFVSVLACGGIYYYLNKNNFKS